MLVNIVGAVTGDSQSMKGKYFYIKNICAYLPTGSDDVTIQKALDENTELGELSVLRGEQKKKRQELESRLRSVAYSCSTLKQLNAALPEFEKYMPSDKEALAQNLPALANVVADFIAAGWPKDKEKATA